MLIVCLFVFSNLFTFGKGSVLAFLLLYLARTSLFKRRYLYFYLESLEVLGDCVYSLVIFQHSEKAVSEARAHIR